MASRSCSSKLTVCFSIHTVCFQSGSGFLRLGLSMGAAAKLVSLMGTWPWKFTRGRALLGLSHYTEMLQLWRWNLRINEADQLSSSLD